MYYILWLFLNSEPQWITLHLKVNRHVVTEISTVQSFIVTSVLSVIQHEEAQRRSQSKRGDHLRWHHHL